MSKSADYVTYDGLRKDANVLVDGRKSHNDGNCVTMERRSKFLIDLGEILSIHHITTNVKDTSEIYYIGIYIPVFFSVPFLFGTLIFACYNEHCQLCRT